MNILALIMAYLLGSMLSLEVAKEQAFARGQTALVLEIEKDLAQVKGSSTLPQSKLR